MKVIESLLLITSLEKFMAIIYIEEILGCKSVYITRFFRNIHLAFRYNVIMRKLFGFNYNQVLIHLTGY